jgi:hypothetical protein
MISLSEIFQISGICILGGGILWFLWATDKVDKEFRQGRKKTV